MLFLERTDFFYVCVAHTARALYSRPPQHEDYLARIFGARQESKLIFTESVAEADVVESAPACWASADIDPHDNPMQSVSMQAIRIA